MGHEMTHGFDDEGAKFDAEGNLKNWWTPEDLKNFKARGDCIAQQFQAFEFTACTKTASWWRARVSPIWAASLFPMRLSRRPSRGRVRLLPSAVLHRSSDFSWDLRKSGPGAIARNLRGL